VYANGQSKVDVLKGDF